MEGPSFSVVVVGGGVAGLSAAYYLEQAASEEGWDLSGVLMERERRLGGKLLTLDEQGFLIESGPDSFLRAKPWALQLVSELGIEDQVVYPETARVFLLRHRRLHAIPEGMVGLVPSSPWAIWKSSFLSLRGKVRASLERFVRARRDGKTESLGAFLRRRLGVEAAEVLAEPFTAGVYGGDAQEMSLRALFPMLADWEERYGSLTGGIRAARGRSGRSPSGSAFCSLRDGMASLPQAIAARLQRFTVLEGKAVSKLDRVGEGERPRFRLSLDGDKTVDADFVVLAIPAGDAAPLVHLIAPEASRLLGRLAYAHAGSVHLAFSRGAVAHPLNGSGFLVPRSEPSPVTGCTWVSSKWPERSQDGSVLIRAFLGWAKDDSFVDQSDDALVGQVTEHLRPLLGLQGAPERAWVHRWPEGMPQYEVDHLAWLDSLDDALATHPGLLLTGASYRGIGVPDCVRQGKEAAQRVREMVAAVMQVH